MGPRNQRSGIRAEKDLFVAQHGFSMMGFTWFHHQMSDDFALTMGCYRVGQSLDPPSSGRTSQRHPHARAAREVAEVLPELGQATAAAGAPGVVAWLWLVQDRLGISPR